MLRIVVPASEGFDEQKQEFVYTKEQVLHLEHSLVSLSKWESKWHKPFFSMKKGDKSDLEILDYIRCMTLTQNVDPEIYFHLSEQNQKDINAYIDDPMTATTFSQIQKTTSNKEIVTSELVYYWMIAYNIPVEFEKWHFNRLMTLIKICNIKNQPPKKMSKGAIMKQNTSLNAARRAAMHTRG